MMTIPQPDVADYLTTIPADDPNFRAALHRATQDQLKDAILSMHGTAGNTTRILACQREIRQRMKKGMLS